MVLLVRSRPALFLAEKGGAFFLGLLFMFPACSLFTEEKELVSTPFQAPTIEEQEAAILFLQRVREVEKELQSQFELQVTASRVTMGDSVPLQIVLRNPFSQDLALRMPKDGYLLEWVWEFTRWIPTGEQDIQKGKNLAAHLQEIRIPAGGAWEESLELPLNIPQGQAALAEVLLGLRLRLDGVHLGEETFPIPALAAHSASWTAFPAGWEPIQQNPFEALQKAVRLPQSEADRHVLVATALLKPSEHEAAIRFLCEALDDPPNRERLQTVETALEYLTGFSFPGRKAWKEWWRQRQNEAP